MEINYQRSFMKHTFTVENIETIAKIFDTDPKPLGDNVSQLKFKDTESDRKFALEIYLGLDIQGDSMYMVPVYANNTFLQLHNSTAFVASEILQKVTFFGTSGSKTSGLIIEKEAGCCLHASVDGEIKSGDFTQLPEDLMMCGIALSLTESMDDDFSFED